MGMDGKGDVSVCWSDVNMIENERAVIFPYELCCDDRNRVLIVDTDHRQGEDPQKDQPFKTCLLQTLDLPAANPACYFPKQQKRKP